MSMLDHQVRRRIHDTTYSALVALPTIGVEPKRDWQVGFLTGYRLLAVAWVAVLVVAMFALQDLLWPVRQDPKTFLQEVWSWASVLWVAAALPGFLGLLGMMCFRQPTHLDNVPRTGHLVSWRIVSRGTNLEALRATILKCRKEMANTPLFDYVIEVVTEADARIDLLPQGDDVMYLVVPVGYATPSNSRFKARGLQYALQVSEMPDDAWLVHLDEESHPTSSMIKGVAQLIEEEEASGRLRVGQGPILYHRSWKEHPFLTLADTLRTGDDFARFSFQYKLGVTLFGMHGSYIVCRNDVEKSVGFDFGPVGSITEDAFWALVLMDAGGRARWCHGYLEEQSTQSVRDFVRQRRRWYQGLLKVSLHAPVKLRWRFGLGLNTLVWTIAPFTLLYSVVHFGFGFEVRPWIRYSANFAFASFITLYLIGLKANMDEYGTRGVNRLFLTAAQLILIPVFSLMEAAGVLSAIFRPVAGFHVVQK